MFKKILLILALLSLCTGVPMVLAQSVHGSHHGSHSSHEENHTLHAEHGSHGIHNGIHLPSDEMLAEWGCDPAMIKTLRAMKEKYEDQSIDLEANLKRAERNLERAHEDEKVSEKELHSAIDGFYQAKADLLKLQATAAVQARETMGEEIFGKIHEAHQDR